MKYLPFITSFGYTFLFFQIGFLAVYPRLDIFPVHGQECNTISAHLGMKDDKSIDVRYYITSIEDLELLSVVNIILGIAFKYIIITE
jgi:hypothetical protein